MRPRSRVANRSRIRSRAVDAIRAEPPARSRRDSWLACLLVAGVALRFLVLCTAGPFNADEHFAVIRYMAEHGKPPTSELLSQAHHPPLYHALMAVPWRATQSLPLIHFFSFACSTASLLLFWRLVQHPTWFGPVRRIAFAFACFLPQFVMYGSYV